MLPAVNPPGEESQRALEEEQARAAEVQSVPPSFIPKDHPTGNEDDALPDETLFGSMTTKVVAIIVAVIVVVAAAFWAMHALQRSGENPADAANSSENSEAIGRMSMWMMCRSVRKMALPRPRILLRLHLRRRPKPRQRRSRSPRRSPRIRLPVGAQAASREQHRLYGGQRELPVQPAGQSGYGYHVHLDQPHDVYRMNITIRTSGGKGYIRANTTEDPTQGEQVPSLCSPRAVPLR